MVINFTILRVMTIEPTKSGDYDRCFCLVRANYSGHEVAKPLSVICKRGLLTSGAVDLVVTGSVSLRVKTERPMLSVFVDNLNLKTAKRA